MHPVSIDVRVRVKLRTEKTGRDVFSIKAHGMPPNRESTTFLLEQPGNPFGAAEYIGDFSTNRYGNGSVTLKLIVEEAFSSTLVGEGDAAKRVREELDHVGVWFADPKDDDFCIKKDIVTPFDGDDEAGVQVLNSAKFLPGAPLP